MGKIEKICESCGKIFYIYKYQINKTNCITICKGCHQHYVNRHEEEYEDYFNLIILDREILGNIYVNH